MAVIGSLGVNILSKYDGAGTRKGRQDLKGFRRFTETQMAGLASALTALAPALSVGAMIGFVNSTINSVDALAKQASSLSLSINTLERYQFAVQRSGGSTEGLERALRTMQMQIGLAKLGTGSLAKLMEAANIPFERFKKLAPEKQFETIGKTIANIKDADTRMAAFASVFGSRAGQEMANFFKPGALDSASAKLKEIGGAIDPEDAANAEKFADAMLDLQTRLERLGRGPVLASLQKTIDQIDSIGKRIDAVSKLGRRASALLSGGDENGVVARGVRGGLGVFRALNNPLEAAVGIDKLAGKLDQIALNTSVAPVQIKAGGLN